MGGRRSLEIVKSYVFSGLPLKAEDQPERFDGWSPAVETWLEGSAWDDSSSKHDVSSSPSASEYLKTLTAARGHLLGLLQTTGSNAAEVAAAQTRYLTLLVEVSAVEHAQQAEVPGAQAPAVLRSTWLDSLLPLSAFSADHSSGSSSSSSAPGSKWFGSAARKKQAAAAAAAAAQAAAAPPCSGYCYEAANTLLAVVTWKVAKAGALVMAPGGADSGAAMEAYQLYCQAAGMVDELRRGLLPQLGAQCVAGDLSRELLTALHLYALGEAQSLMLQRALALNYQGSTLAAMATDTAMLFSQAYEAIEAAAKTHRLPWHFLPPPPDKTPSADSTTTSSGSSSTAPAKNGRMAGFERVIAGQLPQEWPCEALPLLQLAAYIQYQLAHCYCMASICAAETALSSNQAGQAVALAQLGTNLCEQLADLGYEQSGLIDPVSTLGSRDSSRRLALQQALEQKAALVLRRCLRENRTIYFQYVPDTPSALPWPQRSAQPELFRLPAPQGRLTAPAVQGLITATAVGSLSGFQQEAAAAPENQQTQATAPAAAAVAAKEGEGEEAPVPAAAQVIEPPVVDMGRHGSRGVTSPSRLFDLEFNSLAELAERTTAAVAEARAAAQAAAAEASLAPSGWEDSTRAHSYESGCDSLSADEDTTTAAAATAAAADEFVLAEDSSSFGGPAVKAKAGDEASSPVSSYTLTAAKDIGSTASTDGSSSSSSAGGCGGCSTPRCGRFSSSSGASVSSSSSSSGGSCCWAEAEQDGGSVCSSEGEGDEYGGDGAGFGGLLAGLFGCCVAPRGTTLSDTGSEYESEGSEEFEDAWETASEASRCSSATKQTWTTQKHSRRAK